MNFNVQERQNCGARILIVEDDREMCRFLSELLEEHDDAEVRAEPGTFSDIFGGEEGVEYVVDVLGRDARAVVLE
ncbi:MAG: hypothetical protein HYY83_07040, partial [Deltaproteobacteria bacterium]|nr:hypothetical protein [Deltaproteobacteria bacterium]